MFIKPSALRTIGTALFSKHLLCRPANTKHAFTLSIVARPQLAERCRLLESHCILESTPHPDNKSIDGFG
jgi:hypothetical protein